PSRRAGERETHPEHPRPSRRRPTPAGGPRHSRPHGLEATPARFDRIGGGPRRPLLQPRRLSGGHGMTAAGWVLAASEPTGGSFVSFDVPGWVWVAFVAGIAVLLFADLLIVHRK